MSWNFKKMSWNDFLFQLPAMGLYSATTIFWQLWFWPWITHKDSYAVKWINQTKAFLHYKHLQSIAWKLFIIHSYRNFNTFIKLNLYAIFFFIYTIHLSWCIGMGRQWCFFWIHGGVGSCNIRPLHPNDPVGIDLTPTPIPAAKLRIHTRRKKKWPQKRLYV